MLIISKDINGDWDGEIVGSDPIPPTLFILNDPERARSPEARSGWTLFVSDEQVDVGPGLTLTVFSALRGWFGKRWFTYVYDEHYTRFGTVADGDSLPLDADAD